MSTNVQLNPNGLKLLKSALHNFSKFVINSSDDFSFEEGIIADTPQGIVIQFKAGDIDGGEQILQISNLSETSITYSAPKSNKYTRDWMAIGLRGDQQALLPHFNQVIQALIATGIPVGRLDWNFTAAYTGKLNHITTTFNKKTKDYSIKLQDPNAWGLGE